MHTKGPWWFRDVYGDPNDPRYQRLMNDPEPTPAPPLVLSSEGQRFIMAGDEDDATRVALVDMRKKAKRGLAFMAPDHERDCNARLIAAAPLMLEALEKIADESAATWVADVANAAIAQATFCQRDHLREWHGSAALRDMLEDARRELDEIREALGVAAEPHQSLHERVLEAARKLP